MATPLADATRTSLRETYKGHEIHNASTRYRTAYVIYGPGMAPAAVRYPFTYDSIPSARHAIDARAHYLDTNCPAYGYCDRSHGVITPII